LETEESELEIAAKELLEDYLYDKELTSFLILDSENFID
jgi:hypothetical protein